MISEIVVELNKQVSLGMTNTELSYHFIYSLDSKIAFPNRAINVMEKFFNDSLDKNAKHFSGFAFKTSESFHI